MAFDQFKANPFHVTTSLDHSLMFMEKKEIVNSWSKHNLPSDVWPEILSRLPVKSLLRFRCVSKSWRSLIDDPNFCRSHLCNFKNNYLETHLVVDQHEVIQHEFAVYCSKIFTKCVVLDPPDTSDGCTENLPMGAPKSGGCWEMVCSLDGLVLLRFYGKYGLELTLWNPSIRRARVLHLCHSIYEAANYFDLGLGFDPVTKDYKHVRLVGRDVSGLQSVELYTVGSGVWRTIQYQDVKGGSGWHWSFICIPNWRSLCCRGSLYFTPSRRNSRAQELVSFYLSSEVFDSTSLPMDGDKLIDKGTLVLLDGGCSLGLATVSCTGGSIWALESSGTGSMYWTKRYTFPSRIVPSYPRRRFYYIKKNGELLVHIHSREITSYNLETQEEKALNCDRHLDLYMVCAYVESLLLLNG